MADLARSKPPFRADHVGSLLRPDNLHAARAKRDSGEISAADLKVVEDQCIQDAITVQQEVGLLGITDGEFRRKSWHYDFLCGLDGIVEQGASQGPTFSAGHAVSSLSINGKISNPNGVMLDHFDFLNDATDEMAKFCIPSPNLAYHRGGRALIDPDVYPDTQEFWDDLCAAYQAEIEMLFDRGCRYLQLDDTTFAMLCDDKVRQGMVNRGDEPDQLIVTYAKAIAKALEKRPADLNVTIHMCRGNFQSTWIAEGGYEPVAEAMFAGVPVDGFFMEYDSDRAGGFEPLRFVTGDAVVVLGLVSSKLPELETKDELKRRIDEAAKYVPLERLCLSPQCGFASTVQGNKLTQDEQKRKLALVVETAAEVWGSV